MTLACTYIITYVNMYIAGFDAHMGLNQIIENSVMFCTKHRFAE